MKNMKIELLDNEALCSACQSVCNIGGLVGPLANQCPTCGERVFLHKDNPAYMRGFLDGLDIGESNNPYTAEDQASCYDLGYVAGVSHYIEK
jgi:hypothetical protein